MQSFKKIEPSKRLILYATAGGKLFYSAKIPDLKPKNEHEFKNCSSPFRKDKNPSFNIRCDRSRNRWIHNDFGDTSYKGDVFDFAASLYNLDVKKDFQKVIEKMCSDLKFEDMDQIELQRLLDGTDGTTDTKYYNIRVPQANGTILTITKDEEEEDKYEDCFIRITKKDEVELSQQEISFLSKTGISYKTMLKYKTSFISGYDIVDRGTEILIDRKKKSTNSIWMCFEFNNYYKIYSPSPKRFWFVGKKKEKSLFGTPRVNPQFDKHTPVFLTAGEKDTLCLLSRGYHAMCLNSETESLTRKQVDGWRSYRHYKVTVLYDIDKTGIEQAQKIHAEFNLPYILLPNWLKEKGGKDVTDFFTMGGTKEEFDAICSQSTEKIVEQKTTARLCVRTATQRLMDAQSTPDILPHVDVLFQSNELTFLFGDTGKGKSIMAVGIADALSKGTTFLGLENKCGPLKVLYYDFELSDKQFQKRYTNSAGVPYQFSDNLFIDNFELSTIDMSNKKILFEEELIKKVIFDLKETDAKVLIIDNITFLTTISAEDGQIAMRLMKLLKELKTKENISVLVLAHTPKRFGAGGLSTMDIAGSKHLSNFADSVMALAASKRDPNLRYIKQVKASRTGEIRYEEDNIIICEIEKNESFLTLVLKGYGKEIEHLVPINSDAQQEMKQQAIELKEQGKSYQMIADMLGTSKSTVGRWFAPPATNAN